ncbi:hypothetical protein ABZY58_11790 [Micromonospora tulbaghiae]|uniref:hypothetical protein n=1 Tax=Micromonospora tulbaghiae TaxID=479978 RepID=UPI00339E5C97
MRRLAHLVARYGRAIRCDLRARYNLDLHVEWQQRRWSALLDYIDRLPRDSQFVEALTSDEEWAMAVLDQDHEDRAPSRRMSEWSPHVEVLTSVLDAVRENTRAVVAAAGGKPGKFVPAPRPRTAIDRARKRKREITHNRLKAKLLPNGPATVV